MLTTALLLGAGLVARPAASPTRRASPSITALPLVLRLVAPHQGLPRSALRIPEREGAAWSGPTQLTHPTTGTTCTLLILGADPGPDAGITAPPRPEGDPGIMGSASPCVR
jgi:hypothetical protein